MGAPRFVMEDFWPSDLFLGGIPGAWYDPTDLSTMFQDSAGTTPVTAVEQPVGLVLDKSQGLALGAELSAYASGFTSTSGITPVGATLSLAASSLVITSTSNDGSDRAEIPVSGLTLNARYLVSITARRGAQGVQQTIRASTVLDLTAVSISSTTATAFTWRATATATSGVIRVYAQDSPGAVGDIAIVDSISVKLLAGNHASQSTAASRPTYRARYNQITQSEDIGNAVWLTGSTAGAVTKGSVVTTDPTGATSTVSTVAFPAVTPGTFAIVFQSLATSFLNVSVTWSVWMRVASGTATIYLNCEDNAAGPAAGNFFSSSALTLTTTWQRFTLTGTRTVVASGMATMIGFDTRAAAGQTNAAPLTVQVWGAQLLTAADVTATGNEYQRIAASTVYDTAPIFRPYLAFDGVDDSLATAAINFTSTDKMTVFAGVTKSSDAGVGIIAELSPTVNSSAGSFMVLVEAGPVNAWAWAVFGTQRALYAGGPYTSYIAPTTNVTTVSFNIAGATIATEIFPRVNTLIPVLAAVGTDAGTGNFGTWPLYIGRRGGTTLPLNGRIYELIVRGAASSVTEIADTELWVNARTGAY